MSDRKFSYTRVLKELRAVAAEQPGKVVPLQDCEYYKSGDDPDGSITDQPSCIVGHVFNRLGIGPGELTGSNGSRLKFITSAVKDRFSPRAQVLLELVQDEQDDQVPWEKAVRLGVRNELNGR